jgi:hypothetical protein
VKGLVAWGVHDGRQVHWPVASQTTSTSKAPTP